MSAPSFAGLLAWAYRGEVSGQELFAGLADAFAGDGHRAKLEVLAELEGAMAQALVPVLERYGVAGGDDERSRQQGRDSAAAVAPLGWVGFLEQLGPATDNALDRYRTLIALCPGEPNATLDLLVEHELALQDFGVAELDAPDGQTLESVNRVLERLKELP